ncbi:MAG: RagB/SusD family nutrient uptake outer membrane protein, partial [Cyclobacteriaceae bacterium]|nr:RagB/SusD family nutrient uptake outer membrane protein [Cyclobacteriaceae bacterium]
MKKQTIKILAVLILSFWISGCQDYLMEEPRSLLSPNNFFNSDVEAKQYVNGVYGTYMFDQSLYNTVGLSRFYMFGTDLINPNRYGGEGKDFSMYTITEGNNPTRNTWQNLYRVIQDCNIILDQIEDNVNISEAGYKQTRGEALYLRALAYYHATN